MLITLDNKKKSIRTDPVLVTVSGTCTGMEPAIGRVGCVLSVSNGVDSGRYYVPLSPHDCRTRFPEGRTVKFRIYSDARPDGNGIYDTAGTADRLWKIAGAKT